MSKLTVSPLRKHVQYSFPIRITNTRYAPQRLGILSPFCRHIAVFTFTLSSVTRN